MEPYYSDDLVTLYNGDCLDVMDALDAEAKIGMGTIFRNQHKETR